MSSDDYNCTLRELVRSFAMEYFNGKLRWYHKELQGRIRNYSIVKCDSIDKLTDVALADLFSDLWSLNPRAKDKEARKNYILEHIDSLRFILKKFLCEESVLNKDYLEILKEVRLKGFALASLTEIASFLYPSKFLILNSRVIQALEYLSKKDVPLGGEHDIRTVVETFKRLYSYIERKGKRISEEDELKIKESYRILREVLDQVLKYLREVNGKAHYVDVDAFMFFISVVSNLEAEGKTPPNVTKEFKNKIESSFGKSLKEIFDDWLNKAKAKCVEGQVKPVEVDPCQELDEKDEKIVRTIVDLLSSKKQIVLYGVPGTGKTFLARCVALKTTGSEKQVVFATFHPSYSYEDFVEGIRPVIDSSGRLVYRIEIGLFKEIVVKASCDLVNTLLKELKEHVNISGVSECRVEMADEIIEKTIEIREMIRKLYVPREKIEELISKVPKYVLVIDEINRGDMARIFGELITLLENDKRLFGSNEIVTLLPYSKKPFYVPPNLLIIGTMNSADRSIAFVDYALRRRFAFVELEPNPSKVPETVDGFKLREFFIVLNEYLAREIDRDHRIGHSYFMNIDSLEKLRATWFSQIRPLLMEYFYGKDSDIKNKLSRLYTESFIDDIEEFRKELNLALENLRESTQ